MPRMPRKRLANAHQTQYRVSPVAVPELRSQVVGERQVPRPPQVGDRLTYGTVERVEIIERDGKPWYVSVWVK